MSDAATIRHADLPITPWKNGAGRKADIASGPGWTLGYAWLEADAPFSDYSGHDRTITLVEGMGFGLVDPAGRVVVRAAAPFQPAAFDGGTTVGCRLTDGPCRVLNVMTQRVVAGHTVHIHADTGCDVEAPGKNERRFLVSLRGTVELVTRGGMKELAHFDSIEIFAETVVTLAPGDTVIAITLAPAA